MTDPKAKRRFRECTTALCRRGFYGPAGPCPDCRCGARISQLYFRLKIQRAGEAGTRRRRDYMLAALLGAA